MVIRSENVTGAQRSTTGGKRQDLRKQTGCQVTIRRTHTGKYLLEAEQDM